MVAKSCPLCNGLGYLVMPAVKLSGKPAALVKVNVPAVLADFRVGMSTRKVGLKHGISSETARVIARGTWAGFRKQTS